MPSVTHTPGSFCWFELATTDQNAAKKFYSAVFGWDINDNPMGPDEVYTIFKLNGADAAAAYGMRPDQRAQGVPPHWMPYIFTKSADQAAARAAELGGTVLAPPFDVMDNGRMSVLQDPTGATFCVWQPNKTAGTGITGVHGTAVWADLSTPDQVRGAKFYSDLFGWKMVAGDSMKPAAPGTYFHIVNGKNMVGGVPPAEHRAPGVPPHWLLYYQVNDCDGTIAKVKSLGGRVVAPPMTMENVRKFAVLSDAQGAVFAIVQELQAASQPATAKAKPSAASKSAPKAKAKSKPKSKPKASRKPARKAAKPKRAAKARTARRKPAKKARPTRKAGRAKK